MALVMAAAEKETATELDTPVECVPVISEEREINLEYLKPVRTAPPLDLSAFAARLSVLPPTTRIASSPHSRCLRAPSLCAPHVRPRAFPAPLPVLSNCAHAPPFLPSVLPFMDLLRLSLPFLTLPGPFPPTLPPLTFEGRREVLRGRRDVRVHIRRPLHGHHRRCREDPLGRRGPDLPRPRRLPVPGTVVQGAELERES